MAGKIINILQKIVSKGNEATRKMVSTFVTRSFIEHVKSPGDILYKMGMLVPVFELCSIDKEHTAVLLD